MPAYTAFAGDRQIASGPPAAVALAVKVAGEGATVFSDETGAVVDLDLRGTDAEVVARLPVEAETDAEPTPPAGRRGRPKLGVVAREVTLLPRHWLWLNRQPGGASVALRKLVEAARKASAPVERIHRGREAAYRVLSVLAGDRPGYEEALRALFAGDRVEFAARMADWPADIRAYALRLSDPG